MKSVLVIPGTGRQALETCAELKKQGYDVYATARDPDSAKAKSLREQGVTVRPAQLKDADSIRAAVEGIEGVFMALPVEPGEDVKYCDAICSAAEESATVRHVVFSTVLGGSHPENFPEGWRPTDDYPMAFYWAGKGQNEARVRALKKKSSSSDDITYTILQPGYFSTNFHIDSVGWMMPGLREQHILKYPFDKDTRIYTIVVADIARFAAAALADPARFGGKTIPLASEGFTLEEWAETIAKARGFDVRPVYFSKEDEEAAKASGVPAFYGQFWWREVFAHIGIDLDEVRSYGVPLTPLEEYLRTADLGW